ncbi:DUF2179 domain-containing protein [Pontiella sulfatireligans]|uniref:UPF0316 protein SCARR_01853 n=1 Tax=Pontiella sulfatireligans TaxID=2750658 RepID=A0A6C2UKG0_9BACT|nr:DUF2179 domain-containing protein [Pontiella sulfatireligans]VGO19794.1 hypothetical protein SCARR_01853 [Pontiella sulfatireligans]
MHDLMNYTVFIWVVIPLLICLARIIDVSLGTLRIILVSRGQKIVAPILGFFEILIWLLALGQIMQNLTHIANYIAYALGFAFGNYIGILLEEKLAIGKIVVQVIARRDSSELVAFLRNNGFSVNVVDAEGSNGHVHLLFAVIKRSQLPFMDFHIKRFNPKAFYTVEDVRFVSGGVFPATENRWRSKLSVLSGIKKK